MSLTKDIEDYGKHYASEICSCCSVDEQKRRKCILYGGVYPYCEHKSRATAAHFKTRIDAALRELGGETK